jgi:hypothetical protein
MRLADLTRAFALAAALVIVELPSAGPLSAQQKLANSSEQAPPSSGSQIRQTSIEYKNPQYGFCFSLPKSWKGYSILVEQWTGYDNNGPHGREAAATGPLISIRPPQWTAQNPRQDIPIMVFTIPLWKALQEEKFSVGAAPIAPGELGRNRTYVFAIPARFDYAFPTGYEEVEQILQTKPLHSNCKPR